MAIPSWYQAQISTTISAPTSIIKDIKHVMVSTIIGSTIQTNTLNVSSLSSSTIQGNALSITTLLGDTIQLNILNVSTATTSTIQTSTLSFATLLGSTIQTNVLQYSTITGSSIQAGTLNVSSLIGSSIQTSTLTVSSLIGSSIKTNTTITSSLIGCTIETTILNISSSVISSIQLNILNISTLNSNVSQLNAVYVSTILGSTLIGSTFQINTLNVSSSIGSTIQTNILQASTLTGSTIQTNSFIVSTMSITSTNAIKMNTLNTSTTIGSTITGSTIQTNQLGYYNDSISTVAFDINVSSIIGLLNTDKIQTNSLYFSTLTGSTINASTLQTTTLLGSTIINNRIQSDTLNVSSLSSNIIQINSISGNNISVSSIIQVNQINTSTIMGSTMFMNRLDTSTIAGSSIQASQMGVSSIINPNSIQVNTLNANMNMRISTTMQILGEYLIGSTIQSNAILGRTLNVSSATGSTIIGSTIQMTQITISTIVGSTIIGSNFQTNKIMTTDGNKVLSTSATNVSQLEYIAGLVSQAGGTGQSNTWVSTNTFNASTIFNGLSTVSLPSYALGIDDSYKLIQFVPSNQSLVGILSTNYTPYATAVSTLNNSIIYYVSTTDLAIGQTSSAIPTGISTTFTIPGLLQTPRLYAGTGDFSKIVMANKLDGLDGKVIADYQGCNFYSGRMGNNGTGNLSDVLYLNSWYNWGAPAFNTTDSFNVRNNIVVSSDGTGYATLPSFTPSSTELTFSVLFTCTGSTMPANSSQLFNIGNVIDAPTRAFGIGFQSSTIVPFYVSSTGTVLMTSSTLQRNTIYHAVWTISSAGTHQLYINGQQSATMTKVISLDTLPYFYLGKSVNSSNPYPNITIHDFRMIPRYLSTTELQSLYNWIAYTFNITNSYNVRNDIVVSSAGTGFVTMPSFTPSSTALTFSALFICTGSTMPAQFSRIFDIGNLSQAPTINFGIRFDTSGTITPFYVALDGTVTMTSSILQVNTMYHIVWTISSSGTHILYINGQQSATMTKVITLDTLPYFYLGKSLYSGNPYPNMKIHDFRIMNRYLSTTEIQSLYNWGVSKYITADSFNVRNNVVVTSGGSGYATLSSFTPSYTTLTFSVLFICTGSTMPAQWARIFDIGNTSGASGASQGYLITFNSDNTLGFHYRETNSTITSVLSTIKLNLNTMYHVVWTISSSGSHVMYINGRQAATITKVITLDTLPYFYLGKSNWTADPYPNMTIFDFRMMNRYLSFTEVQALYDVIDAVDQSPYISGRYIELYRSQVGCFNLAEIRVYSYPGGPNIITPSTTVTLSNPDVNSPVTNFVDGNLDAIAHNNCSFAGGPLTVDLGSSQPIYKIVIYNRKDYKNRANGTVLTIKNSSNTVIYTANPISDRLGRTTLDNSLEAKSDEFYYTFTYFPSYAAVIGDNNNNEDVFANVVMFDKTNIGMRIYQAENNSTQNYTSYKNALMTDTNSTNISLGQNTDYDGIVFGPNKTYGAYLNVGSGGSRLTSTTAQVFSSNGNLHVDCTATGKGLYLNNMSNSAGNYIYSYTPWRHYNTLSIPSGSLTVSSDIITPSWFYIDGAYGMYWTSYSCGIVSPEQAGNPYGHASTWGSGRNGWSGWGIGSKSCWMSNGGEFGIHDNSYSWTIYCNGASNKYCVIGGSCQMSQNWDRLIVCFNGYNTNGGYFYVNQGGGWGHISDERIKENIRPIDRNQSIEFINGIIPSNFCIKDQEPVKHRDASGKETGYTSNVCNCEQTGFIAQNVLESARKVGLPDTTVLNAVDYEKELLLPEDQRKTTLSLNPVVIISHSVNVLKALIDNIDEQQLQIDELNRQLLTIEVDINNLQQIANQQNQQLQQLVANI